MEVLIWQRTPMEKLLEYLRRDYPELLFTEGKSFCWSPQTRQIFYSLEQSQSGPWAVLHETAHALLEHTKYSLDFELLRMEVAAWEAAKELAKKYDITIDEDHMQDCLDSYRDWLYKRSICPSCGTKSIQQDHEASYQCFNCHSTWRVAASRFCRPYRQFKANKKSPTAITADDSFATVTLI
jgi:ribosomal protein S27AE